MFDRHREAGAPDPRVIDASEYYGEGALLITSGVPDYVTTPPGFDHAGIGSTERCDVQEVYQNSTVGCPKCPSSTVHKLWLVRHTRTQTRLVVYECSACKSFSWTFDPRDKEPTA